MMLVHFVLLSLLVACTGMYAGDAPVLEVDAGRDRAPSTDATVLDAALEMVSLSKTPGIYRGACDGSAAAGLDFDHFLGMSDNDQQIRVYKRGTSADPLQTIDLTGSVGATAKVDFEDLERVGHRIYAISSHGRKDDGNLDLNRYRFVGIDVGGQAPSFTFAVAGSRSSLLSDMLATANWSTPNQSIIDTLQNASKLDKQQGDNIKPQVNGMNIEGLAHAPTTAVTERMMIGLRNPRPNGKAIAVSLNNAAAVVAGATAQFGEAFLLDFGGLGIRGMSWSPVLQQILIVAGPHDDSSAPFKLYRWAATPGSTPTFVSELAAPLGTHPEGIVTFANSYDIEIVFDADKQQVGNTNCEGSTQKSFTDTILRVE